jgi:hypothetical protein
MSRHRRNHWSRDRRSSIELGWESWAMKANAARPPLPDVPRPVPMKIEEVIAKACALYPAYAVLRAAWEAVWMDGMPDELKSYREALAVKGGGNSLTTPHCPHGRSTPLNIHLRPLRRSLPPTEPRPRQTLLQPPLRQAR